MYTLSVIFNKDCSRVLMRNMRKQVAYNFICGNVHDMEDAIDASYRELLSQTGITDKDVELHWISSISACTIDGVYSAYITTGILNKDIELKENEDYLEWISIANKDIFTDSSVGNGICYQLLNESINFNNR